MRIRRDDQVIVLSGKDKGKTGKVLRTEPKKDRVFVEGLNIVKRHQRPSALNPNAQAGVIEREGPIHVSNVALVCSDCGPTRIRHAVKAEGKKVRLCAKCGKVLD